MWKYLRIRQAVAHLETRNSRQKDLETNIRLQKVCKTYIPELGVPNRVGLGIHTLHKSVEDPTFEVGARGCQERIVRVPRDALNGRAMLLSYQLGNPPVKRSIFHTSKKIMCDNLNGQAMLVLLKIGDRKKKTQLYRGRQFDMHLTRTANHKKNEHEYFGHLVLPKANRIQHSGCLPGG